MPLFQATSSQKVARENGVITEIMVKRGGGHGWPDRVDDEIHFVKCLDKHLLGKPE